MKKRYIYSLLFGVPGLLFSFVISALLAGFAVGILWIFVFGDSPWPGYVDKILPTLLGLLFLAIWAGIIGAGFIIGKRLESNARLNKAHVLASAGLTLALVLFIVLSQFSAGDLGPKPDSTICSDYCTQKGFLGGSMPPRDSGDRTCSCLDNSGKEVIKVPVESIQRGK